MKTLNVTFTDKEYKEMKKAKQNYGDTNWHYFILLAIRGYEHGKNNN
jgi:hypothetical protein